MRLLLSFALLFSFASVALAQESQWLALPKDFPKDVRAFIERRMGCFHWEGEPMTEYPERNAQIHKALEELRCSTRDQDEAAIKSRYAKNPIVLETLEKYRNWSTY